MINRFGKGNIRLLNFKITSVEILMVSGFKQIKLLSLLFKGFDNQYYFTVN